MAKGEINLKAKAMYFLARREYSYKELFIKLCKYTDNTDEVVIAINQLKDMGYLSDERYIKSYLNSKSRKSGLTKIKYNLQLQVDNKDLIEKILQENPIDEYQVAKELWEKKFGSTVALDKNQLAKQIRFLQSRGFSFTTINKIIKTIC